MWCVYRGGACGYSAGVEAAPFNKFVSAGGSSLFKGGQGCGACYQVNMHDPWWFLY